MAHQFDVIHTLEARSNFLLESLQEHFGLSDSRVHDDINQSYWALRAALDARHIDYNSLKSALVPNTRKFETAFCFDWTQFKTDFYGQEVMNILLPNLDRSGSRSVLYGDWTSNKISFATAFEASYEGSSLGAKFPNAWNASTVAFYYLNNLTATGKQRVDDAFSGHPAYMGTLDLTYTSLMKALLSTMLIRAFVQHKDSVIQAHEGGEGSVHQGGHLPWDFARHGLRSQSVDESLYLMFLSYKIERPVLEGEVDVAMSLKALTPTPTHIEDCTVELDEPRLHYLRSQHAEALSHAGFAEQSASELAQQIKAQLRGGYIYSMGRSRDDDTLKFNVIVENPGHSRVQCGLKYFPSDRRLAVITLF